MSKSIQAKFGVLEEQIIHISPNEEFQRIKSLIADISNIRDESKNASLFGWAMSFLGAAFSALLTLVALSNNSEHFSLVCSLIFTTSSLGIYFLWNWKLNKKKEVSILEIKKQELKIIFEKIEGRVQDNSTTFNEYEELLKEETPRLKRL